MELMFCTISIREPVDVVLENKRLVCRVNSSAHSTFLQLFQVPSRLL